MLFCGLLVAGYLLLHLKKRVAASLSFSVWI